MSSQEINTFEKMLEQVKCTNKFACVVSSIRDLCDEQYNPEIDLVECVGCESNHCDFTKTGSAKMICTCPLRNYIVKDFDKWAVDNAEKMTRLNLWRV